MEVRFLLSVLDRVANLLSRPGCFSEPESESLFNLGG